MHKQSDSLNPLWNLYDKNQHYILLVRQMKAEDRQNIVDVPSKFFSTVQSYCPRLSVVLLSYDSRSTLIRLDRRKNLVEVAYANCEFKDFFLSRSFFRAQPANQPTNQPKEIVESSPSKADFDSFELHTTREERPPRPPPRPPTRSTR